jgi:hypothetical protein
MHRGRALPPAHSAHPTRTVVEIAVLKALINGLPDDFGLDACERVPVVQAIEVADGHKAAIQAAYIPGHFRAVERSVIVAIEHAEGHRQFAGPFATAQQRQSTGQLLVIDQSIAIDVHKVKQIGQVIEQEAMRRDRQLAHDWQLADTRLERLAIEPATAATAPAQHSTGRIGDGKQNKGRDQRTVTRASGWYAK